MHVSFAARLSSGTTLSNIQRSRIVQNRNFSLSVLSVATRKATLTHPVARKSAVEMESWERRYTEDAIRSSARAAASRESSILLESSST